MKNGQVVRSIPAPAYWPMGLTWDGEAIWNIDVKGGIPLAESYNSVIYRLSPKDGTILKTVQAPTSRPRGLAWDGKYLWCVNSVKNTIIKLKRADYPYGTVNYNKIPNKWDDPYLVSPPDGKLPWPHHRPDMNQTEYDELMDNLWIINNFGQLQGYSFIPILWV